METTELTEDLVDRRWIFAALVSAMRIDGNTYIDAVLNTATNLEEAIRRGADELWVIWTTSQRGHGATASSETSSASSKRPLTTLTSRCWLVSPPTTPRWTVRRVNSDEHYVREIKSEVALHYLFNFNQRRFRDEVEHGVTVARAWCDANKIERLPQKAQTTHLEFNQLSFLKDRICASFRFSSVLL